MFNLKVLLMGFQLQARLSTVQEFYINWVSNDFYLLIEPCDSSPSNLKSISEITNVCVCYNDEEDMKSCALRRSSYLLDVHDCFF